MPRIFDNIDQSLRPALQETLEVADRADFCVGYFNLRGWKQLDHYVDRWAGGDGHCCRLLVGMQTLPHDELREALSFADSDAAIDNQTAARLRRRLAGEFREQLAIGVPTNADEQGLRRLAAQIKSRKVVVKLFLRHRLHAKLYLLFRPDPINPSIGFVGSSNLTFAGLSSQGELNVDVMDHDACNKLARWFDDRWNDRFCVDISEDLVKIIDESWAREETVPPYHIYVKMAYHLSEEARLGLREFRVPRDLAGQLFDFQTAAVKIAAHHLNKRNGVLIGDVVGLGKTLMATAVARVFEDDHGFETLIICPKNLVPMWEDYREQFRLHARVLSISRAATELPHLRRYRLVLIDESHNLRNREGRRYRAIQEYIQKNDSKVLLLSATPYNKSYLDLGSQLRLFLPEDRDIGIRPEEKLRELGETEFLRQHQCGLRTLAAFEHSEFADDWRELMRLFLVRRTRSFIQDNYAETDPSSGRKFLKFPDGTRSYFPTRDPKTVRFTIDDADPSDQYARLYGPDVVDAINHLNLPRYGLGNYVVSRLATRGAQLTKEEFQVLANLSRAGRRLMGFCRTNLFKRLESSGYSFLQSVERHVLRNYVYLHAIENDKPIPLGTQEAELLDSRQYDGDADDTAVLPGLVENGNDDEDEEAASADRPSSSPRSEAEFAARAAEVYNHYESHHTRRFKWIRPSLFSAALAKDLRSDARSLLGLLRRVGNWDAAKDQKLEALRRLLLDDHPNDKVIVFTQFADTVRYLEQQLRASGETRPAGSGQAHTRTILNLRGVTGQTADPTGLAWRFSPVSNQKRDQIAVEDELRVLIATDVLSEGQNLQDCAIVVNYDLPWAIIRLVQRAGRVDRIGQQAEEILCFSFLPADGVERIIRLRQRVRQRLRENAEVVGTDEQFFEDDNDDQVIVNLYNERAGILDGDTDTEVDLGSYAYQIWKNAITQDKALERVIPALPPVVYSTKAYQSSDTARDGVLVYTRTADGNDALAWVDREGRAVTESQFAILKAAECSRREPALSRLDCHHELVQEAVKLIAAEEKTVGGQLGAPSGARFRVYERLKHFAQGDRGTLFDSADLTRALEDIYRYPLRSSATDILNRQLRLGIADEGLADLVLNLRNEDRLCLVEEQEETRDPQIICSMGLAVG